MEDNTQIVPAILAETEEDYKLALDKIEESGLFPEGWLHIDITDGEFVSHKTIEPEVISKYPTSLKTEIHLMVNDPVDYLSRLGDDVDRVIIHSESGAPLETECLAINPETSLGEIAPHLSTIKLLLIMGVHPGSQGAEFITETIKKVKEAARLRADNNLSFLIGVDGGVSEKNIKTLLTAGADHLVIGSHLLKGDIHENIEKIWEVLR